MKTNTYKKNNGITLIETLLSVTIVMAIVVSALYWYLDNQREQQAIIFGKDLVSIITAFDKRIHVDGWDDTNFKNGKDWTGSSAVIGMLNTEFIAKNASCGQTNNWVPVLDKEKNTKLLPCNFWSRVPYDLSPDAKITSDVEGFVKNFTVVFKSKNDIEFMNNFRFYNKAKITANVKDSLNITGSHQFYFASVSSPSVKITNNECLSLKASCALVAVYDREGGNEYLRVDGTNSVIGAAVTFKESKGDPKLRCVRWEKDFGTNSWESKTVDCGIGIYDKTKTPVAVEVAVNATTTERVMLDKLCPVFTHNGADQLINSGSTAPCGMYQQNDSGNMVAYQVIENLSADKGLIKTLYADTIFTDKVNVNYLTVKKDLAVLGNTTMDGTLRVKGFGQFDDNLNVMKDLGVNGNLGVNGTGTFNNNLNVLGNGQFNNDVTINRDLNALRNTILYGSATVKGVGQFDNNVNINGNLGVAGNSTTNGILTANGTGVFNNNINLNRVDTVNTSCGPTGSVSRDSTGALLSCVNGVWKPSGDSSYGIGTGFMTGIPGNYANRITGNWSCPAGLVPNLIGGIQIGGCNPCLTYSCSKP